MLCVFPSEGLPLSASQSCVWPTSWAAIWRQKTAFLALVLFWKTENIRLVHLLAQWPVCVHLLPEVVHSICHHHSEEKTCASASPASPVMWLLGCLLCLLRPPRSCLPEGSPIVLLSIPRPSSGFARNLSMLYCWTLNSTSGVLPSPWPPLPSSVSSFALFWPHSFFPWCWHSTTSVIRHRTWFCLQWLRECCR